MFENDDLYVFEGHMAHVLSEFEKYPFYTDNPKHYHCPVVTQSSADIPCILRLVYNDQHRH